MKSFLRFNFIQINCYFDPRYLMFVPLNNFFFVTYALGWRAVPVELRLNDSRMDWMGLPKVEC